MSPIIILGDFNTPSQQLIEQLENQQGYRTQKPNDCLINIYKTLHPDFLKNWK